MAGRWSEVEQVNAISRAFKADPQPAASSVTTRGSCQFLPIGLIAIFVKFVCNCLH